MTLLAACVPVDGAYGIWAIGVAVLREWTLAGKQSGAHTWTMKPILLAFLGSALLLALPAAAQERSAGQAYDAQVNWGALRAQISSVIDQNKLLAERLDKIEACSTKKMLYEPTSADADADGCISTGGAVDIGMAPLHTCSGDGCTTEATDKVVPDNTDCVTFTSMNYSRGRYIHVTCEYIKASGSIHVKTNNGYGQCGYVCKH